MPSMLTQRVNKSGFGSGSILALASGTLKPFTFTLAIGWSAYVASCPLAWRLAGISAGHPSVTKESEKVGNKREKREKKRKWRERETDTTVS